MKFSTLKIVGLLFVLAIMGAMFVPNSSYADSKYSSYSEALI